MVLEEYLWLVIVGGITAFFTAFGIGANDVANAFASSVGSRALKLWQAVIIAAIFEFCGAVLLGAHVTSTIRKGITSPEAWEDDPELLMFGMLCALMSAGIWLMIATYFSMPVSTTHSIIGGILGFTLVGKGTSAVDWTTVGLIVLSWFVSPVLSGVFSSGLFWSVRRWVLRKSDSLRRGFIAYHFLVALTLFVNCFFIIYKGAPGLGLKNTPLEIGLPVSIAVGIVCGILAHFLLSPYIRHQIKKSQEKREAKKNSADGVESKGSLNDSTKSNPVYEESQKTDETASDSSKKEAEQGHEMKQISAEKSTSQPLADSSKSDAQLTSKPSTKRPRLESVTDDLEAQEKKPTKKMNYFQAQKARLTGEGIHDEAMESTKVQGIHEHAEVFDQDTEHLFTFLQVLTAIFDSFAHGANDVANSIAPFAAIYSIYLTGAVTEKSDVPVWILCLGGAGIVAGLALYGYKIIVAIGMKLAKITPSRGFTIELGAAFVVVIASRIGIPVSTTHCQVGATTAVGAVEGKAGLNWSLLLRIAFGWVITLVVAGLLSGGLYAFGAYSPTQ